MFGDNEASADDLRSHIQKLRKRRDAKQLNNYVPTTSADPS